MAFYYADDIPVYATSHIHERSDSRIDNIDLNGIRFCDMPWKLTNAEPLQTNVFDLWPLAKTQLAPYFALGVDAYRLIPRIKQLQELPGTRFFGSTGILSVENNVIKRQLMWARFSEGNVISVPIVAPKS